jgi:parallel beta-helix repeat protein
MLCLIHISTRGSEMLCSRVIALLGYVFGILLFLEQSVAAQNHFKGNTEAQLRAAIAAIPTNGGALHLPAGIYRITEPLRISGENIRVTGDGAATVIQNDNRQGQPAIVLGSPDYAKNPKARVWRTQLSQIRVTGTTNSGHGILARGVQELFLTGITVDHNGGHGISLENCYENPRISSCMITYNGASGVQLFGCHDIVVSANQFEENQDALRCHDSFNLTMTGNNIDDHLRHGVVIENTYGSVLSGNMIEECNGTAVILDRDVYGVTVSANVIAHNMGGGVHCLDANGCAISANTFTLIHNDSIRVESPSGRLTITGNNFCNSYTGAGMHRRKTDRSMEKRPIQWDIATGIRINGASDIAISGNVFAGLDGAPIVQTGGATNIAEVANIFTDNQRHPANPTLPSRE